MTEIYSTSEEYVDMHGRKLPVLIKSDGTVFIPLSEIRKTGFHVFSKTEFFKSQVEKSMALDELRLYLLGAAREFLIQKDVNSINGEEINRSIEECREKLAKNDLPSQNHTASSGVLGRTLLRNPAELAKSTRLLPQMTSPPTPTQESALNTNSVENSNQIKKSYQRMSDPVNSLRTPRRNDARQVDADLDDSNKNQLNAGYKKKFFNNMDKNRNDQNRSYQNNNAGQAKNFARTNSESRSNSENEEGNQFVKLSDLTLKRIELLTDMQDIKVVHIDSKSDKLKFWVQLVENDKIVMEIMEKCMEIGDECPVVPAKMDKIYLAQDKEDLMWYRVIVTRVSPVIKVHFLDFGNDAVVTEVRSIPDDLSAIPAQAVRIVLSKPENSNNQVILETDQIITVKKIKQFIDTTYVVQMCDKKRTSLPPQVPRVPEPILMNEIKYSKNVLDKDVVKIVAYSDGKLYLRNKDHHAKLVEVDLEIRDTPKQTVNNVVPDQLVLTKKVGSEEKLCRAVVRKIENNNVTVHFVDYHKEEEVPLKNLFSGNEKIAKMPVTLIEIPLRGYSISKFDTNAATKLEEMIANNAKFTVVKSGMEFDLINREDKSISEILFPSVSEIQNQSRESHSNYKKVLFEEMACYEAPMGKGDYLLTNYKDPTEFTVVSTNSEESEMLAKCTGIHVTDEEPYEPDEMEMILAHFEGAWYRASVIDKSEDEVYTVLFVEYGNMTELSKEDIRRFPEELKNIPMLGLLCQLKVKNSDAVKNRLKELLTPDNIYEMDFLSFSIDNLQYTVDIPKITSTLKKEDLI